MENNFEIFKERVLSEFKTKDTCKEYFVMAKKATDFEQLSEVYFKAITFCLANEVPSLNTWATIDGIRQKYGIYASDSVNEFVPKLREIVCLGTSEGNIEIERSAKIYLKHQSKIYLTAKKYSYVCVDLLDDAEIYITAEQGATVSIFKYNGNGKIFIANSTKTECIKIKEMKIKTYNLETNGNKN